jgi:hypothetical protein
VRTLIAIFVVALMVSSSAFARKASQHHSKRVAPKHQSTTKTDPGGVARDPNDVALDRKIGKHMSRLLNDRQGASGRRKVKEFNEKKRLLGLCAGFLVFRNPFMQFGHLKIP